MRKRDHVISFVLGLVGVAIGVGLLKIPAVNRAVWPVAQELRCYALEVRWDMARAAEVQAAEAERTLCGDCGDCSPSLTVFQSPLLFVSPIESPIESP